MYATCLFCSRSLGGNQTFETFPVGRRLAYDAAKGRLWVVCPQCERWNLTPLEERWEAIEQAERLYRDTRLRAATDNIGLAKLRDGTELVRIGEPLRPEFAAWRYGDQFGRRRRRQMLIAGAGLAAVGGIVAGGVAAGAGVGGFGWMLTQIVRVTITGSPERVVAKIATEEGRLLRVQRGHLAETTLLRGDQGPLALSLRHEGGRTVFQGREASRVTALVMPKVNRYGGTRRTVQDAVSALEETGGAEGYIRRLTGISQALTRPPDKAPRNWRWAANLPDRGLFGLNNIQRLALEMALHEEAERRAMEGELAALELAWKEAEEIAAISDNLFLPGTVVESLAKLRARKPEREEPSGPR